MITTVAELPAIRKRFAHKRIVFTCGTFDLIHPGHVDFLAWCKQQGDMLVVAVNPDHLVRLKKGPARPIQNDVDRMQMVVALKPVNYVVQKKDAANSRIASMLTAQALQPDIIVLGHDWADDEIEEWLTRLPTAQIVVGPRRAVGRSTSNLIETIRRKHGETTA
ncbi:MAG TPA: adenylyltransferase/cytidyltransferase family protein [Candidatus Saccharimonadales bacterium]|nr:adenylyltransferase/cytidyltransferase family protein [Candidatus Saccharimonadales bacterium]